MSADFYCTMYEILGDKKYAELLEVQHYIIVGKYSTSELEDLLETMKGEVDERRPADPVP